MDYIKAKLIFLDDPVYSVITATAYGLPSIFARPSVAHSDKQVDYKLLKEAR